MERTPIFPSPAKNAAPADYLRNYWCPHYDACLVEAADRNLYLDCSHCGYKDVIVPDVSFACALP